ncbi:MAG: LPS export ABC transporter periplasmic protein LptC [Elusimicrobiaceae bacterium]|nr:LPS export ABC transporter periplasmic protein LptC [Elusimicrobiaceae bacterium]
MKLFWIFVLAALLTACTAKQAPVPEEDAQVATNVSIFSSKENQKQWVLEAQSVNFENMQSATLKNPRLLLKQNGEDSATVSGDMGTFNYAKQLVTIDGNATVQSLTQKIRITAPRFFYNVEKDRVWSDAKTIITRGTARSVAINGIETNSKLTKIIIKKHATQLPATTQELKGTKL